MGVGTAWGSSHRGDSSQKMARRTKGVMRGWAMNQSCGTPTMPGTFSGIRPPVSRSDLSWSGTTGLDPQIADRENGPVVVDPVLAEQLPGASQPVHEPDHLN